MSDHGSITQWIQDVREGNSQAAGQLWNRYFHRLVRLAQAKLRDAPQRMADEEDVVVNAFDSFFRGAEQGRFPQLDDRDDLWQVLVMLTARKAINQRKHEFRQKRGGGAVRGESIFHNLSNEERAAINDVVGSEPTPGFAAEVAEQFSRLLERLDDETLSKIAVAKLEGYTNDEIAQQLDVRTRTVERKLRIIREIWSVEIDLLDPTT